MKPTRGATLAGLVLVAVAAPLTAYAVAGTDDSGPAGHAAGDHGKGHAYGHDKASKPDHATGQEHANEASAPGRAHAEAMKAWAHCVAEAASGPKTSSTPIPPKQACGDKPMAPGRADHAERSDESPGKSGDHRRDDHSHGHSSHAR